MAERIVDIAYHKAQIEHHAKRNVERLDLDVSDCALSSWASSASIDAAHRAIEALELGLETYGEEIPAVEVRILRDHAGKQVQAKLINGEYGLVWLLGDDAADRYGRRFVPCGERSRIQKELQLHEGHKVVRAKKYLSAACAGLGCPVSYYCTPEDDA